LTHYIKIETTLSTDTQLLPSKRASDGTDTVSRQFKNPTWGRITSKYNCPRTQECVDGDRVKVFLRKTVYLLVEKLPIEMRAGDYTEMQTWIETDILPD